MGRKDGDVVMFDGKISAADLITDIISEADVAYPVSERSYVGWLNATEQLIYSEIIKEQREICLKGEDIEKNVIKLSNISVPAGEDNIRFEDIYTVYVGSKQLIKTTLTSGKLFDDTYYKSAENLGFNCPYTCLNTIAPFSNLQAPYRGSSFRRGLCILSRFPSDTEASYPL